MVNFFSKILMPVLYIFVFFLPWQTRWIIRDTIINGDVWEYGRLSLYAFDLVFLAILFSFVISHPKEFKHYSKKLIYILPFLVYLVLSLVWSPDKLLTGYFIVRFIQILLLVVVIFSLNFSKIKLATSFILGVLSSALLGLWQFFSQSALANKWFGLAEQLSFRSGTSVIETLDGRWLRAYGSLPHPNILAGFILLALVLCLWLIFQTKKTSSRLLITSCSFILVMTLFFTFSRSIWLVGLILSLVYLFLNFKKKNHVPLKIALFSGLILFFALAFIYWPLTATRLGLSDHNRLEAMSATQRVSGFADLFSILKNNFILGTGPDTYTLALQNIYSDLPG